MFTPGEIIEVAGQSYKVVETYKGDEDLVLRKVIADPRIKAVINAWSNFTTYSSAGDENRCERNEEFCDCVNEKTIKIILDAIDSLKD